MSALHHHSCSATKADLMADLRADLRADLMADLMVVPSVDSMAVSTAVQ